jgi:hypothetical protein
MSPSTLYQGGVALRPYSRISRPKPLLFLSSSSSIVLMRLSGSRSRPITSQKIWLLREPNPDLWIYSQELWRLDHKGGHCYIIILQYIRNSVYQSAVKACQGQCGMYSRELENMWTCTASTLVDIGQYPSCKNLQFKCLYKGQVHYARWKVENQESRP